MLSNLVVNLEHLVSFLVQFLFLFTPLLLQLGNRGCRFVLLELLLAKFLVKRSKLSLHVLAQCAALVALEVKLGARLI